jgi:hypothetical protein
MFFIFCCLMAKDLKITSKKMYDGVMMVDDDIEIIE